MIDASLEEVFVGGLRRRKEVLRDSAAEVAPIRQRKESIEEGHDRRIHGSLPRACRGNGRYARHAQPVDQRFERPEEEGLVSAYGAACGNPELITLERWNRIRSGVEEVFRVDGRIAEELERGAAQLVCAR